MKFEGRKFEDGSLSICRIISARNVSFLRSLLIESARHFPYERLIRFIFNSWRPRLLDRVERDRADSVPHGWIFHEDRSYPRFASDREGNLRTHVRACVAHAGYATRRENRSGRTRAVILRMMERTWNCRTNSWRLKTLFVSLVIIIIKRVSIERWICFNKAGINRWLFFQLF